MTEDLPSRLRTAFDAWKREPALQSYVEHNVGLWVGVNGGQAALRSAAWDYWHRPERRLLIAFFAGLFDRRWCPAAALRRPATRTVAHFGRAHEEER